MWFALLLMFFQSPDTGWDFENMEISMLTCDPGSELYSVFGHSALRVKSDELGIDHVYNWGTFDFNTENFYIKFLRGKLPYKLTVAPYPNFLYEYHYTRRGVREQLINATKDDKEAIWNFLSENLKPENAEYAYDFFFDNCSTRIRDIVLSQIEGLGTVGQAADIQKKTYRNLIHEYLGSMPWTRLGIDLLIGRKSDREADFNNQMFLPDYMHDNLALLQKESGETLMDESYQVLIFEEERSNNLKKSFPWPIPVFLLAALFIYFGEKRLSKENFGKLLNTLWGILAALGVFLLFMVVGTDHIATKLNYNLMYLHPAYLLLFFVSAEKKRILLTIFTILAVLYLILAVVAVANSALYLWPLVLFVIVLLWSGRMYYGRRIEAVAS
jgi:hypothetical protein